MWVIFLLSAMSVAISGFIIAFFANKILIAMEEDRENSKKKRRTKK